MDSKSFRQGSWGAEIVDALKPEPGDIVIEGKRGLCGFASTNLDFILAQPRHLDHRAWRVPHQLLRRIDDADRLREGL